MGGTAMRKCCDRIGEVSTACPNPALTVAHRKRVEELILEVDEARQENQRLNKQTHKLRLAIQDANPLAAPDQDPYASNYGVGNVAAKEREERLLNEEVLQLKRTLWDLQRENSMLKQQQPQGGGAGLAGPSRVSMRQYQQLKTQLDELQQAYDKAAAVTDRMMRQQAQAAGAVPSSSSMPYTPQTSSPGPSPPRYSTAPGSRYGGGGGGSGDPYLRGGRMSHATSRATSGAVTPVTGLSTPVGTNPRHCGLSSAFMGGSPSQIEQGSEAEADFRRKLQAMQTENEKLRRKVRMLAAN